MDQAEQKRRPIALIALVAVLAVGALGWVALTRGRYAEREDAVQTRPKSDITLKQYESLPDGATYAHIFALLGRPGTEISRNSIGGFTTIMYQWTNSDGSNMNAMFQNDRLVSKAQFGLW